MGHTVRSISGAEVGGVQAIMFTPDPGPPATTGAGGPIGRVNGFYRGG